MITRKPATTDPKSFLATGLTAVGVAWPWPSPTLPATVRYGAALVLGAAAVAATLVGGAVLRPTPFLVPLLAVAVSAWVGGFGPAVTAAMSGAALTSWFVLHPPVDPPLPDAGDAVRMALFVFSGALIGGVAEARRRAAVRAGSAEGKDWSGWKAPEERLPTDLVLKAVSDGITVQGADGRLVYANDAAARLTGLGSGEELMAAAPTDLAERFEILDESGAPLDWRELPGRIALREGTEAERLVRYRLLETGEERWSLVRARPALDADGTVRYAVNVIRDLSASRAKSEFLSVMSHELRTPLNAIMGYQELLEHEIHGPLTGKQREQLARIGESSRHLLELVEQMLTLSRIEAGREEVRDEPVVVAEMVHQVVALVEPLARRKGLDLDVHVEAGVPGVIRTDSFRARQVLLNLLSNAVKFTDRGGIRTEVDATDAELRITVRDTGPGIAEDERERIFEPFFQGTLGTGMGRAAGAGLGLAVARNLAGLLGGSVTLSSQEGVGSAFTFALPRSGQSPG